MRISDWSSVLCSSDLAIGLGATIALMCDVIFASDTARFADPHVRAGIVAGDGGAIIWPQLVGYARAKEYLLTGDAVKAVEAERIGLINHVAADEVGRAAGRGRGCTYVLMPGVA